MKLAKSITHKAFTLLSFFYSAYSFGQPGAGSTIWNISPISNSGMVVVDWREMPPLVNTIASLSPSPRASTVTAINRCGEPVFYVVHSGIQNKPNNLFIYDIEGNPLLNEQTSNGPGFNSKAYSGEIQIINVPGSINEWYIIYQEWKPDNGAPMNNGDYVPAKTLYSRVKYTCGEIFVLDRDIPLKASGGNEFTYTNGKALSFMPDNPDQFCLYCTRRSSGSDYFSLDRFMVNYSGIEFDKNTGDIYASYWWLTIAGSPIEVSSDGKRIAVNNRVQAIGEDDIFIFDATLFSNIPGQYQAIKLRELYLQPDYNVLSVAGPVSQICVNNPSLYFLVNMESKVLELEFSPNGEYLYFVNGGFAAGGYSNATYIGQIELGPVNNPVPYPYNLRLQIQKPPGSFDPYTGAGGLESSYPDTFYPIWHLEKAYDNKMYFIKRNSPYLYIIPYPDVPMPQQLIPSDIDLSDANHSNIQVQGKMWLLPDYIDGMDFLVSTNPIISLGEDTLICDGETLALSPGDQFVTYCWQDGSSNPVYYASTSGLYWVEVMDEFGCFAYDTILISTTGASVLLGSDKSICEGDSVIISPGQGYTNYLWQDGSSDVQFIAKTSGLVWVEVTVPGGCIARDSVIVSVNPPPFVDIGPDQTICIGDIVTLDAGPGYDQYYWQDGSDLRYLEISTPGLYWVEVKNPTGCWGRDSINIDAFSIPIVNMGPDTALEFGQSIVLDAGTGFVGYTWQDGTSGQYYEVSKPGYYSVTVYDGICYASDTVIVTVKDCEASLFIPNCFTPNGDGYNDEFKSVNQNLEGFEMLIFNRWGQKLFETSDPQEGWNGRVNGRLCPIGTYFYLIKFTTPCKFGLEDSDIRKGSVTLLE